MCTSTKEETLPVKEASAASNIPVIEDAEEIRFFEVAKRIVAFLLQPVFVFYYIMEEWAHFMKSGLKVTRLFMDVLVLALETTKLFLEGVTQNAAEFTKLFQHLLILISPDFIQMIPQQFAENLVKMMEIFVATLTDLVERILEIAKRFIPIHPSHRNMPADLREDELTTRRRT